MKVCPAIEALPMLLSPSEESRGRIHEVLVKMRNYLDWYGFAHSWQNKQGNICLMTAMGLAIADEDFVMDQSFFARDQEIAAITGACLAALGFHLVSQAIHFNDLATRAQVYERLDSAIARTAPPPYVELVIPWDHEWQDSAATELVAA